MYKTRTRPRDQNVFRSRRDYVKVVWRTVSGPRPSTTQARAPVPVHPGSSLVQAAEVSKPVNGYMDSRNLVVSVFDQAAAAISGLSGAAV